MSEDILVEFIDDAREHLEIGGQHLLRLEKDPSATEDMHGLLRSLHTIKGNAGFLDLNSLYTLLHKAENILQTIREQSEEVPKAVPAGLIDIMFQVLDTVEAMLGNLSSGKSDHVDWLERLTKSIDDIDATLNEEPGQLPTTPLETVPPPGSPKAVSSQPDAPPSTSPTEQTDEIVPDEKTGSGKHQPRENADDEAKLLGERIESFLLKLNDDTESDLYKTLENDLELIRVDVELWARPEALHALNLIRDYLAECHVYSRPLTGTTRNLLISLGKNLKSWLGLDPAETDRVIIMELDGSDLEQNENYNLVAKVKRLRRRGMIGVAFDLRLFDIIRSSEIGVLIAAFKESPDPKKVGLIIDPIRQTGLFRVLRIMALDKTFRIFNDMEAAQKELAG